MRARRVWSGIAAAALVLGLGVAGAAPASADQSATVDCLTSPGLDLVLSPGETLTLELSNCYSVVASGSAVTTPAEISYECATGDPGTVTTTSYGCLFSNTGPGITRWSVTVSEPVQFGIVASFYRWDDITPVPVTSVAPPTPVPAWVQAFGRQQAENCPTGWNASWQHWAEPVTGGWVCTRSIPATG